jgi:Arc/MetJ-type ribon-helix-helix transcriptional regulator
VDSDDTLTAIVASYKLLCLSKRVSHVVDREIERFLDETGFYTNKSEFIRGACRSRLRDVNSDAVVAARRAEQLLANAEQNPEEAETLKARLEKLGENVDPDEFADTVTEAREETADSIYGQ